MSIAMIDQQNQAHPIWINPAYRGFPWFPWSDFYCQHGEKPVALEVRRPPGSVPKGAELGLGAFEIWERVRRGAELEWFVWLVGW